MNEWQKIETAPKDGRQVLVYSTLGNPSTSEGIRIAEFSFTDYNGDEWWQMDDGRYVQNPSHWMPLPEPPHD
jgi:hypothetical protein